MQLQNQHRFRVGRIDCTLVNDGTFEYPVRAFLSSPPQDEMERALREHGAEGDHVVSSYPSLLIDTGRERVLVDTGAGKLAETTGGLAQGLREAGTRPEDIDVVILTHGHPDHIGGNLDAERRPAFPNARYVMVRDEWEFWASGPDLSGMEIDDHIKQTMVAFADENLSPLEDVVELKDSEGEIVEGVKALHAPGHTPGHMALVVRSEGEELLHLVDAVLHPILMERPEWYTVFGFDREQARATRQRLLDRAAEAESRTFLYHFPFPGLGQVSKREDAWEWEPLSA